MAMALVLRFALLAAFLRFGMGMEDLVICGTARGDACDSLVDGADDASLVQIRKQELQHRWEFPDIREQVSKAADYVRGFAEGAQDSATNARDAISDAVASALMALANTLNRTLAMVAAEANELQARVANAKVNVTSGIATLLGRSLNVPVVGVPVGEQYVIEASSTLGVALMVWKTMGTSSQTAVLALTQGLDAAGLSNVAATFNSSLQAALANASAFVASLESIVGSLTGRSNGSQHVAVLLNLPRTEGFYEKVNDTVQAAEVYVAAFPKAFLNAFAGLQDQVVNNSKSILSARARARVSMAWKGAQRQAEVVATSLSNATSDLMTSISTGLSLARPLPPVKGSALSVHTLCGLPFFLLFLL